MTEDNKSYKIKQENSGDNQKIAARDYYEDNSFKPETNNPNLTTCSECGFYGLHIEAPECPHCKFPHAVKRQEQRNKELEKNKSTLAILLTIAIVIMAVATQLSSWTNLTFANSLATSVLVAGILYYIWILVAAHVSVWLQNRKRQ